MDSSNDSGDSLIAVGEDTNMTAPWPFFLFSAITHNRGQALTWITVTMVPTLAIAAFTALAYPSLASQAPLLLIIGLAFATYLAERNMTRTVVVIREDQDHIMLDEQSWWRDEERRIPDAYKHWNGKRPEAWLYLVTAGDKVGYKPFVPWTESLKVTDETATSAHVAGVRVTMGAAERVARHRTPDGREVARYGMLTLIILAGLLGTYLAGNKAVDVFTTPPVAPISEQAAP